MCPSYTDFKTTQNERSLVIGSLATAQPSVILCEMCRLVSALEELAFNQIFDVDVIYELLVVFGSRSASRASITQKGLESRPKPDVYLSAGLM